MIVCDLLHKEVINDAMKRSDGDLGDAVRFVMKHYNSFQDAIVD